MRNFVLIKIICADCGEAMELHTGITGPTRHSEGEPTGADVIERSITVKPCRNCMGPAEKALKAVRELVNAAVQTAQKLDEPTPAMRPPRCDRAQLLLDLSLQEESGGKIWTLDSHNTASQLLTNTAREVIPYVAGKMLDQTVRDKVQRNLESY